MPKPSPSPKPKASFAAGSFATLRSIAGEGDGEPLRITLADIDEDPDQPRKAIDAAELEPLAATIRKHGVLQPIGLYPPNAGRYRLAFGARRFRASRIAGKLDISAIIVPEAQRNFTSQVIENQQRADLSNSDLAAAIVQLHNDGIPVGQIGTICNLKEYQVTAYRAVAKFPPFLMDRLNSADVRALYDLYRQWTKTPADIEAAMIDVDTYVTITEARRIVSVISGKASGSIIAEPSRNDVTEDDKAEPAKDISPKVADPEILHGAGFSDEKVSPEVSIKSDKPASKSTGEKSRFAPEGAPRFIVAIGEGEHGQLVVDRRANTAGWVLVRYETSIEEVELTSLRIVAVE